MSKLIFVVGPNGSGKSTIIVDFLLSPEIEYVCPDDFFKQIVFEGTIEEKYKIAMEQCKEYRYQAVEQGKNLIVETVGSTQGKIDFVKFARSKGYYIQSIIITTRSPEINLRRIAKRVKEGGHDVPPEKVISRYYRMMNMLHTYIDLSHNVAVLDNSIDEQYPKHILIKINNDMGNILLYSDNLPEWVDKYIIGKVEIEKSLNTEESEIFLRKYSDEIACARSI
ncbi:MAG: zeta toxin family protein [Bacillota bacterium]